MRTFVTVASLLLSAGIARADEVAERFELADGFEISLFADNELAHDIFALTFNARGQVVVSGPGYVKTLIDDNGDGRADRAVLFADFPKSGAQGLCFDGDTLYLIGDNVLARLVDEDGDGVADGEHQVLACLRGGEHGGHAILHGPDGWLYVMCGNDAGVSREHARTAGSPVREPRCGAILRMSRDGAQSQVIAHGFRNPYDMAFTPTGQLFTVDSDGERDHHLPWYAPTRLFDVGIGLEHGWLAGGWTNSWSRPRYFFDSVERAAEMGRGSPTGIVCYRSRQFPPRYAGGLFAAEWTFGRVYFLPLAAVGASFESEPQVFLQARGEDGFAPVDLAVSPEGDLYVAIGGRRTRGGVYRIRYVGNRNGREVEPADDLQMVLAHDDPLSSWARARWQPVAQRLGAEPFRQAVADAELSPLLRCRAVEVLVEVFDGIDAPLAEAVLDGAPAALRARIAWGLARSDDQPQGVNLLARLTAGDDAPAVRAAWEGLLQAESAPSVAPDFAQAAISGDRRIGALAAAYAAQRGTGAFDAEADAGADDSKLGLFADVVAALRIADKPQVMPPPRAALAVLARPVQDDPTDTLAALRAIQIALGDIQIEKSSADEPVGYTGRHGGDWTASDRRHVARLLVPHFPSEHSDVNTELARTLAMLECDDAELPQRLAMLWTNDTAPADDLHYLFAMSRLTAPRSEEVTRRTASALLSLHPKLRERGELVSRTWPDRVGELIEGLCRRDPDLPAAVAHAEGLGLVEQAMFALKFEPELQQQVARRILAAESARESDSAPYSDELIQLVAVLPRDESLRVLRGWWDDRGPHGRIARLLAEAGDEHDRARLIEGLSMIDDAAVAACARALAKLPSEETSTELIAAARTLGRYCDVRAPRKLSDGTIPWPQAEARAALRLLIAQRTGESFDINEQAHGDLRVAYRPVFDWLAQHVPEVQQALASVTSNQDWAGRFVAIDWSAGNAERGQQVFERQECHRCHGEANRAGNQRLGPDLAGAADRFSRDDLFAAIIDPSASVAPTFRTTQIVTRSGRIHVGLIVYESPDGTLLQTGPDTVIRITGDDLLAMEPSDRSLMPDGLLNALDDRAIADLYAYLRTLRASP